MENAVFLKNR